MNKVAEKIITYYNTGKIYQIIPQDIVDFCNEYKIKGYFTEFYLTDKGIFMRDILGRTDSNNVWPELIIEWFNKKGFIKCDPPTDQQIAEFEKLGIDRNIIWWRLAKECIYEFFMSLYNDCLLWNGERENNPPREEYDYWYNKEQEMNHKEFIETHPVKIDNEQYEIAEDIIY